MSTTRVARHVTRLSVFAVLLTALAISAVAQSNKGTIKGTVTDQNGGIVQSATITATNSQTGNERTVNTNDDGTYEIPSLDPGAYKVTTKASGFSDTVNENVNVQTASIQVIDVVLTAGQVGAIVTVTTAPTVVSAETSDLATVITGKQVTDLPLPQRNFTLLATLQPGVVRPVVGVLGGGGNFESGNPLGNASTESTRFRESGGSVLVVNGARPTNNNFTLDGVDNNEGQFGQIGIFPPPDVIAEFKIQTSVAPAEGGRAGGGIINATTKSGGNDVHGSVYEFYQGRFASALGRNERGQAFVPNRNTHQFGFTTGGPVFLPRFGEGGPVLYDGRNRSFWFVYYEGQRNATPAFGGGEFPFVTVPTARQRVGDFSELLGTGFRNFTLQNGAVVNARVGTVFCPNLSPAPGNDIRNCGVALSPAALATLQAYPLPTEGGLVNNYRRNRKEKYNRDGYGLRFDHGISDAATIFFAYSKDDSVRVRDNNFPIDTSPNGNDLPSGFGAGEEFGNSRGVRLGSTQTFSPTVINDARFGATRVEIGINNPGIAGSLGFDPNVSANLGHRNINICGDCEGVVLLGIEEPLFNSNLEFIGDGGPFYFRSNNFSFADTLTWVSGSHSLKFGGDFRLRQNANFDGGRNGGMKGNVQYGSTTGGFLAGNYNGMIGPAADDSGSGLANFVLGYSPAFITRGTPGGPYFQSNKEIAFFGQDDWKVNPNLTLNLGLRWDLFTQPTERFDRQTNFNPANDTLTRAGENAPGGRDLVNSDKNNFGPRIGFAYSGFKSDKTLVLRGGYGLLYAVDIPGIPGILSTNPPGGANYSCSRSTFGTASCPALPAHFNLDTGYAFPAENTAVQPGQTFAAAAGTNLVFVDPNVKNELFHQFNTVMQWEFRQNWLAEAGYVGGRGRNLLVVRNIGTSPTNFPGSREVTTHPVVQTLEYTGESWYDALQTKVERRFSRGLSIISTYVWSKAEDNSPGAFCTGGTGPATCGFSNPLQPELDKGPADHDIPHRFTFSSVWELPIGRGRRYAGGISRGTDLLIGGWQLNTNITIQSGPPFSILADGRRVDIGGSGSSCKTFEGQLLCPAVTPVFANDPGGPKFGNSPRNAFRGARQEYVDASLFKNMHFAESFNVQLRIQAYNLFNHLNGFRPVNNLADGNFGRDIAEQRRRQLEFGIKFLF